MALQIRYSARKIIASIVRRLSMRAAPVVGLSTFLVLPALTAWAFSYGSSISIQPETGVVTEPALLVVDADASGGQSVKFGSGEKPGECPAYPKIPDENCTGWQHTGVTLQQVPAEITSGTGWNWEGAPFYYLKVTGNNAVIDGVNLEGCILIDQGVTAVTIQRSRLNTACPYGIRLADLNTEIDLKVIDTEIIGSAVQLSAAGFTWQRVNAHGFTGKAALMGSNTLVEDSYIHDPVCNPPNHLSGIGTNGSASNITMRHNNVDVKPTDCTSGAISNYDDFGPFSNVLIENNLINSGGYCLKAGFEEGAASGANMTVRNNTFGRKYFAECGQFGPVSNWYVGAGNVWSGNVWGAGAAATSSHTTGDVVLP